MSIAAAAPDGRPKRHFSYIKNFILTTFFGDSLTPKTQIPILEPEFEYELYRIPGFNDILIKTLKCKSDELTIVNNSGEEIEIKPFESYIGTKSIKETDGAFRNVYTLLSTGILNQPQSDILQVMVPIINGMHYEAGENIKPFRVHPKRIQPVIINEGEIKQFPRQRNINGYNSLKRPFETIYLSPPLKKRLPLKSYQERQTDEQNIMSKPNLPKLFKQMPHKVFPFQTHLYRTPKGEHQENVYKVKQYISLESEHFRNNLGQKLVPLDSVASRSMHLKKPVYIGVTTKDKYDEITLDDNNISKSIGTTPTPHDFLINADPITEYNYSKTSIPKLSSTGKINNNIYNAPEDKITPSTNHKHSDKLGIVKENDEISSQSPFDINNVILPPLKTTAKELNIKISDEIIPENKSNGSNVVKTSDDLPKSETLSQYIYDHIDHNKSHSDSRLEEKDNLHTELSTDTSLLKNTSVLSTVDKTSINVHNLKLSGEKLRDNSNTSVNKYSSLYSQLDNASKINDVHVIVVKSNDSVINVVESNDRQANNVHTNNSNSDKNIIIHVNLVKANDTVGEVPIDAHLSQLLDEQISYNNSNKSNRIFEPENQVKTNVHTNSPLPREESSISPILDKDPNVKSPDNNQNMFNLDLDGNDVKTNAISNTPISAYNDYGQPITNSPPVNYTLEQIGDIKKTSTSESATITSSTELPHGSETGRISLKNSPIVETDDSANEEGDKESQNFSESFTKGRGDIPYQ
ncbi:unnamed protein product [Arctia plantaginis]|uniref:Uncharacterized protein n=1 Tax=Arctia plantaginis TaxID=874455 RepID=A0A8S1ALW9_ARCPL|nr:unnamed protein product [Arctia plantaginis]